MAMIRTLSPLPDSSEYRTLSVLEHHPPSMLAYVEYRTWPGVEHYPPSTSMLAYVEYRTWPGVEHYPPP